MLPTLQHSGQSCTLPEPPTLCCIACNGCGYRLPTAMLVTTTNCTNLFDMTSGLEELTSLLFLTVAPADLLYADALYSSAWTAVGRDG